MFRSDALIRKLELFGPLSAGSKQALDVAIREARRIDPRREVLHEGVAPDAIRILIEGFGCRYKVPAAGRRQILAFLIPGDICDPHPFAMSRPAGFSVTMLTPARVVDIARSTLEEIVARHPGISTALVRADLVEREILAEWLCNIGRRSAQQRLAHLLCELLLRLQSVRLAQDGLIEMPLTQIDLADALGLTPVHVSRTLQSLRREMLVERVGRFLRILDFEKLAKLARFRPDYLSYRAGDTGDSVPPTPLRRMVSWA